MKYFLSHSDNKSPLEEFNKLTSAINTINGVGIQNINKEHVSIFYQNNPYRPSLQLEEVKQSELPKNYLLKQPLVVLTCEQVDNITVPTIKSIALGLGYRIFNPLLNCFLPEDPNLDDVSSGIIDPKINEIFKHISILRSGEI